MTLTTPYDPDNVFAKILRGDIPCHRIAETDATLAFMDAFPQMSGHCLVIPKTPAVNLFDLPASDLQSLIAETQRVAGAVKTALQPEGITLMQFNGAAAGQTVFHIHFHILPRWADVEPARHAAGAQGDPALLADQAARIAAAL